MMAKCLLKVAGPEAKTACVTTQLAGCLKKGIEGNIHVMRVLWEEHNKEEDWGFLLIDARNAFNEEKPPIVLLLMFLSEGAHRVDVALYPRLQASRLLRCATGGLGLRPGYLQ